MFGVLCSFVSLIPRLPNLFSRALKDWGAWGQGYSFVCAHNIMIVMNIDIQTVTMISTVRIMKFLADSIEEENRRLIDDVGTIL